MLEVLKGIDLIISSSAVVRWALVSAFVAATITSVVLYIGTKAKDLQIVLLETEVAKASDAVYRQNQKIRELGEATRTQKKIMEQAVKNAEQIAIENKKQLEDIKNIKLKGTCDEKVKQSIEILKQ